MRLNIFNIAIASQFERFADQTESFVIGRATMSKQNGLWSNGFLLGRDTVIGTTDSINEYQLKSYLESSKVMGFKEYPSTPGGSGWLFSIFSSVSPLTPASTLSAFRWFISAFSATVIVLIIQALGLTFGRLSLVSSGLGLLFSPMITVAGGHIYWMFGVFLLPMIPILLLINARTEKINRALLLSSIAFFFKCILTGFELITSSLLAPIVMLAFVLKLNGLRKDLIGKKLFLLFVGMGSALILTIAVLTVQISMVRGSYRDGIVHFIDRLETRTIGSRIPEQIWSKYSPIDEGSTALEVVKYYGSNIQALTLFSLKKYQLIGVRYRTIFILYFWASIVGFLFTNAKLNVLISIGWLSFLAPISWLVIFKAHALIHPQLDVLVWFLPTLFFVYASFGAILGQFVKRLKDKKRSNSRARVEEGRLGHPTNGSDRASNG